VEDVQDAKTVAHLLWQRAFRKPNMVDGTYRKLLHVSVVHLHFAYKRKLLLKVPGVWFNSSLHRRRAQGRVKFEHIAWT